MLAGRTSPRAHGFGRGLAKADKDTECAPGWASANSLSGLLEVALSHHHRNLAPSQAPPHS